MGMTITEKILAQHAGRESVVAGEYISAKVDIALGNDITAPIAIEEFYKQNAEAVFDKDRIVLVPDHFCPNKDIKSAMQVKKLRDFARAYGITHFYEVGEMGIEHSLLPEQGVVTSGDLVIGADSHTCTYGALGAFSTGVGSTDLAAAMITGEVWLRVPQSIKFIYEGKLQPWVSGKDLILYTIGDIGVDGALYRSMEFCGSAIDSLPMSGRLTMANMAIEAGAKNGIIAPDSITKDFVNPRAERTPRYYASDPDANYVEVKKYDVSKIEPQVAFPHLPENTRGISEVGEVTIDQVVIGSCTNGLLDDLRVAASILKGRKVAKGIRTIIFPATPQVYKEALREGILEIFAEAGAAISTPTCGPCLGGHMGILAEGERAVATTNRNFVGRMGHPNSEVYLASPAVSAASAILGKIGSPAEL
ncbi:MAG: 3-isopropylmalate dehydratase large subunit [Candidatus Auribacter fodinae]|jgi:3-isopropylmalate/(R)-2-methylmalate dehydratase large subunit|uniref:3-isopropylmalate dehydratase large subunit n=1 Tax=Candidatus Auribacter fodinae TaxID=2093366 RepID=A0A3A4QW47_9BACT|nr:MAG: 3-isopropylmalate dehydratase large subunit [Candidatus Auribacter fodinae]